MAEAPKEDAAAGEGENGDSGTYDRRTKCGIIIHGAASVAATAGAFSVVPGPDAVVIMPVQVAMIASLAHEYDVAISTSLAKSAAYAALGQILGRGGARLLGVFIPVYGQFVRAGVAFSVTEALGWMIVDQLEKGEFS